MIYNHKLWAIKTTITAEDGTVEEHVWPSMFFFTRASARQRRNQISTVAADHVKYKVIRVSLFEDE